jgi:4,5-DOPA dioxygenase extradiol
VNNNSDCNSSLMPVLFVGHGNPMNAIEDNIFSRKWHEIGTKLPRPAAILCISAHWETNGTCLTAMEMPPTIHDFGGFPKELFDVQYPAPGNIVLAQKIKNMISGVDTVLDQERGFDHGCWSVLKKMFPEADIPVIQLSLDYTKSVQSHYDLAKDLFPFRNMGILILCSGNMVHNLQVLMVRGADFNQPFGFDWATEANEMFKMLIDENRHEKLINYQLLGRAVQLAVPTPEHYLPMLYAIALKQGKESISYFNDQPVAGSLTMTSLRIG